MSIRSVKQYSDRGKIKNLSKAEDCYVSTEAFIPLELRMQKLVEFAELTKDKKLQSAMGFMISCQEKPPPLWRWMNWHQIS